MVAIDGRALWDAHAIPGRSEAGEREQGPIVAQREPGRRLLLGVRVFAERGRRDDAAVARPQGVGAQPEIGGQRWPSRRFQASLRETGMPRAVMRLSTLQPTLASTFCAGRVRARSVRPMMVL